jgi:glucosylceramidase
MLGRHSSFLAFAAIVCSPFVVVSCGSGGAGSGADGGGAGGSAAGGAGGSGGSVTGGGGGSGGSATGGGGGSGATGGAGGASGGGGGSGGGGAGTGGTGGTGGAGGSGGTGVSTAPTVTTLVTSANNNFWVTTTPFTVVTSGTPTVTVNASTVMQNWEGMGGAFNEIGWNVIQMLSASDQAKAIDLLFGSDAAGFVFGRIPMSASDYALTRYTDDEVAAGSTDLNMTSFSIARDQMYLIPYAKAAMAVNPNITFWGSPWTPPTWMKMTTGSNTPGATSCALVGATMFDGGCMNASAANLKAYAQYFVKWIAAYKAAGIAISTVSPQNEANYAEGYPSCLWNSADIATFDGTYLGPALSGTGTTIMAGTMSNNNTEDDPTIVTAIFANTAAKGFIGELGYQWGMEQFVTSDAAKYSPLHIWQTEHRAGNYPGFTPADPTPTDTFNATMAPNDIGYGWESWELIRRWVDDGVTSYSAWNMVLDTVGKGNDTVRNWPQDALLTVNTSTKALGITPAYYAFRHVAQFARPGGKVLATTSTITPPSGAPGGDEALAFLNADNSIAVVMYNPGAAQMFTVSVGGKMFQFMMPAAGWATLDYVP